MASAEMDKRITRAAELIMGSHYPVALVGAGMSVESGIPPFRGPGGLWTRYGEPDMDGYRRFLQDPKSYWEERLSSEGPMTEFREAFAKARPNPGHVALAALEEMGHLKCIITQNVDNLHQAAGSKRVAEIHGNATKLRCVGCNTRWNRDEFEIDEYPPECPHCGGMVKHDTVMFGEPIPFDVLVECESQMSRCDCMLLIGTTAEVYPAAGFPREVRARGGLLIEFNPYETVISRQCDVALRGPSGQVLPALVDRIRALRPGGGAGRP